MKKAVFFDIDGTIWDKDMNIPSSTIEAIKRLRENNIDTFLCSGRTRAFIKEPKLLELGFDGIVAGCGTYVEYQGQLLVDKTISPKQVSETLEILRKHHLPVLLEGKNYLYLEPEDFLGDVYIERLFKELGQNLCDIKEHDMKWEISKFSLMLSSNSYRQAMTELKEWYEFIVHGNTVAEAVPTGYSKATGMKTVCEKLGVERANTYAFGDSVNDLTMLEYAAYGIAMGNGMEEAKAAADYVTKSLHEDGIYHGLKHFGLI